MSPSVYLHELSDADPEFIGRKLLELLSWQVQKGQKTFFNLGWYLRLIHRAWQVEVQKRQLDKQGKREGNLSHISQHLEEWVQG